MYNTPKYSSNEGLGPLSSAGIHQNTSTLHRQYCKSTTVVVVAAIPSLWFCSANSAGIGDTD